MYSELKAFFQDNILFRDARKVTSTWLFLYKSISFNYGLDW